VERRHIGATAGDQKGVTATEAGSLTHRRLQVMFVQQQKGALQYLLVAAAALGCSASVLSGALSALSAGTILA
jgi:hypothetical protein